MPAMFAPPSRLGLITRRLAALALVLWLAGVGCIIGCEMNVAAAPKEEAQASSEGDSCPMESGGHDCCKEDGDGAANVRLPKHTTHISCCPLANLSADPARKISTKDVPLAVAGSGLHVASDTRTSTQLPAYRLRVPDRGSTYLRCCVFLI
jgi:hypothetical protein